VKIDDDRREAGCSAILIKAPALTMEAKWALKEAVGMANPI
jgi:hypothetical protein